MKTEAEMNNDLDDIAVNCHWFNDEPMVLDEVLLKMCGYIEIEEIKTLLAISKDRVIMWQEVVKDLGKIIEGMK